MRRPFSFCVSVLAFLGGFHLSHRLHLREGFLHVCALSDRQFYRQDADVRRWVSRCYEEGSRISVRATRDAIVDFLENRMSELAVSHFHVVDPPTGRMTWNGEGLGTGLHSRYVDGRLIVFRVNPRSAADLAGVMPGDEIVGIPDVEEVSPKSATFRVGTYRMMRAGRSFEVELKALATTEDGRMTVRQLTNGARVLRIPSFRVEFFARARIDEVARALAGAPSVVVDVRENNGGSPAAVARTLALFMEPDLLIGAEEQRLDNDAVARAPDTVDEIELGKLLDRARRLEYRVPPGYLRFDGPVTVLIASETASAAEVFADAMKDRPRTRVWGWPSAGAVVSAVWYPVPEFGFGYTASIPRATMVNAHGTSLEHNPIRPQRDLYYDLAAALRGEDSWITEASSR